MAHYTTSVDSPWEPEDAFAYLVDMRNFVHWDPGVRRAELVAGGEPGPDAEYVLAVKGIGRDLDMRYRTLHYEPGERVIVRADTKMFASVDEIIVVATETGCTVTYDAQLDLQGPLGLFDIALKPVFNKIGDRAAAGLQRVLGSERAAT